MLILGGRDPDKVADVIDDAQELHEDAEEISTMLADPFGANVEDVMACARCAECVCRTTSCWTSSWPT